MAEKEKQVYVRIRDDADVDMVANRFFTIKRGQVKLAPKGLRIDPNVLEVVAAEGEKLEVDEKEAEKAARKKEKASSKTKKKGEIKVLGGI